MDNKKKWNDRQKALLRCFIESDRKDFSSRGRVVSEENAIFDTICKELDGEDVEIYSVTNMGYVIASLKLISSNQKKASYEVCLCPCGRTIHIIDMKDIMSNKKTLSLDGQPTKCEWT